MTTSANSWTIRSCLHSSVRRNTILGKHNASEKMIISTSPKTRYFSYQIQRPEKQYTLAFWNTAPLYFGEQTPFDTILKKSQGQLDNCKNSPGYHGFHARRTHPRPDREPPEHPPHLPEPAPGTGRNRGGNAGRASGKYWNTKRAANDCVPAARMD